MILTHSNNRFVAICSYAERHIPKEAGFRWDPTTKQWWTDDADKAMKLGTYADASAKAQVSVGTERLATSDVHKVGDLSAAAQAHAERLQSYILPTAPKPYPYQIAGAALVAERGSCILGDDMGLGKTLQALLNIADVLHNPNALCVVVCPTSVGINWVREAARWVGIEAKLLQGTKSRLTLGQSGLIIVPYSIVAWAVKDLDPACKVDLLVIDELHNVKNEKASRTIATWEVLRARASRTVAMSGTPIPNRPKEIAHIVCGLTSTFGNTGKFLFRYCDPQKVYVPGKGMLTTFDGASHVDELAMKLRTSGVLIRRMKSEVLKDLPSKRRSIVVLSPDKKPKALPAGLDIQDLRDALKAGDPPAFNEIALNRHADAVALIPQVAEWISEHIEGAPDQSLVVFAHHKDVVAGLAHALGVNGAGYAVITATGDDSPADRQAKVDAFAGSLGLRIFIATIAACGTGLNGLQKRAEAVVFAESSWTPGDNEQAEDRVCRIGAVARDSIPVTYLVSDGGIDSYVLDLVLSKQETIGAIMSKPVLPEAVPVTPIEKFDPKPYLAPPVREVSQEDRAVLLQALQQLQGDNLDGCLERNSVGFNMMDARFGADLASKGDLSDKQATVAARMLMKYRFSQVGFAIDVIERVAGIKKEHHD